MWIDPSTPVILHDWITGDNYVNITWTPTSGPADNNPGNKFEVQYRKAGEYFNHVQANITSKIEWNWLEGMSTSHFIFIKFQFINVT